MIIECSWCGSPLGEKPPYEDTRISASICWFCKVDLLMQDAASEHFNEQASDADNDARAADEADYHGRIYG